MARLVTVVLILAVISCVVAAPWEGTRERMDRFLLSTQHTTAGRNTRKNARLQLVRSRSRYVGRRYPSYNASPSGGIGVGSIENSYFGEGSFSYAHGGKSTGPGTGGAGGNVGPFNYGDQTFYH